MSEFEQRAEEAIARFSGHLQPTRAESDIALFMARRVRDAIEDIHVHHLPDEVMPEFNRRVRGALVECLVAMRLAGDDDSLADSARASWVLRLLKHPTIGNLPNSVTSSG